VDDGKAGGILMGIGKAIGKYVGNPANKAFDKIAALYQAEDEVFKLAAYLKAKAIFQQQGTKNEELSTMAAGHVRQWFPYFDSGSSGTLKLVGRTAMPFLSFYRESIRIFGEALKHRPLALATGLAVPSIITMISAMLLGLDDDDLDEIKKDMRGKAGRLTSSPWPDHIDVTAINKNTDGSYTIQGTVAEVTSVEEQTGGTADSYPVTIMLEKRNNIWLITSFNRTSEQ
jgi:hypothetical protein